VLAVSAVTPFQRDDPDFMNVSAIYFGYFSNFGSEGFI
jgi:hypothetical protein